MYYKIKGIRVVKLNLRTKKEKENACVFYEDASIKRIMEAYAEYKACMYY